MKQTTTSPSQWQPWTAFSDLLGLISVAQHFCSENIQGETKNNFTSLSETTSILAPFIRESPPPPFSSGTSTLQYPNIHQHPTFFFNHASFHFCTCRHPCVNGNDTHLFNILIALRNSKVCRLPHSSQNDDYVLALLCGHALFTITSAEFVSFCGCL